MAHGIEFAAQAERFGFDLERPTFGDVIFVGKLLVEGAAGVDAIMRDRDLLDFLEVEQTPTVGDCVEALGAERGIVLVRHAVT